MDKGRTGKQVLERPTDFRERGKKWEMKKKEEG